MLDLFDHFIAPAGNSEKSEQGREESLFRPNRTGMFCVTIIVPLGRYITPPFGGQIQYLVVDSYLNSHALSFPLGIRWAGSMGQIVIFVFPNNNVNSPSFTSHLRLLGWMLGKTRREGRNDNIRGLVG